MLPCQGSTRLLRRFALAAESHLPLGPRDTVAASASSVCVSAASSAIGLVVAEPMTP
jgi:hypothetical protein